MNLSKLTGVTQKAKSFSHSQKTGESELDFAKIVSMTVHVMEFRIAAVSKVLLLADLLDSVEFHPIYRDKLEEVIADKMGDSMVLAVREILPSVNLGRFLLTLKRHYVGLKFDDKELILELIARYLKKHPPLDNALRDVLTARDYAEIELLNESKVCD